MAKHIVHNIYYSHVTVSKDKSVTGQCYCDVVLKKPLKYSPKRLVGLFLSMPWVCLQFVVVVFPDHTHYFQITGLQYVC